MEVLHNTLDIIDNMEISEGNRLILCNELKKLSNVKELMEPKRKRSVKDVEFQRIYKNFTTIFVNLGLTGRYSKKYFKEKYDLYKYSFECFDRWILGTATNDDYRGVIEISNFFIEWHRVFRYSSTPLLVQTIEKNNCKINFFIKQMIIKSLTCDKIQDSKYLYDSKTYKYYAYYMNKEYYMN